MNAYEWETEQIRRIQREGCDIKAHGQLKTYCGVTWEDIKENPYIIKLEGN